MNNSTLFGMIAAVAIAAAAIGGLNYAQANTAPSAAFIASASPPQNPDFHATAHFRMGTHRVAWSWWQWLI
jgi:hypothetical protein